MTISKGVHVGGGDQNKRIYYAPPSGSFPAQIADIVDVMEPDYNDKTVMVPKFRVTFRFIDKKTDGLRDACPAYEFQQDPDAYNPYGKLAFWSVTRAFAAPRMKDGKMTSPSNLYLLYTTVLNGGKPLTAEQIQEVQQDPTKLNALIGGKLMVGGVNAEKPTGGSRFRVKSISVLPNVKAYPSYTPPTFLLTEAQLNDTSPAATYADTGETVYGYHLQSPDGKWKFIDRDAAANHSIERYGDVYSPAMQRELKTTGAPVVLTITSDDDDGAIPF